MPDGVVRWRGGLGHSSDSAASPLAANIANVVIGAFGELLSEVVDSCPVGTRCERLATSGSVRVDRKATETRGILGEGVGKVIDCILIVERGSPCGEIDG